MSIIHPRTIHLGST